MNQGLRIAVADDEPDMRDYFQKMLPRLGHRVVAVARTGRELVELCRAHQPDLVITDIKMPELDGIDAAVQLYRERPVPVILVSAFHDTRLVGRAEADHVMGYLVKPIKQADLEPVIALALRRFEQLQALLQESADLRQALADVKVVDKARGILMARDGLDERDAFHRLQERAHSQNCKLVDMAQTVVAAEEVPDPSRPASKEDHS
jgi:response regulator NasT